MVILTPEVIDMDRNHPLTLDQVAALQPGEAVSVQRPEWESPRLHIVTTKDEFGVWATLISWVPRITTHGPNEMRLTVGDGQCVVRRVPEHDMPVAPPSRYDALSRYKADLASRYTTLTPEVMQ